MTQVAWSQAGTALTISATTTADVPLPATVVDGEWAFMLVSVICTPPVTITWPAGWTEIHQGTQGSDFVWGFARKKLSASDGGTSPTVTFSATVSGVARTGTVLNASSSASEWTFGQSNQGTSTSWDGTAFSSTRYDQLGVVLYALARGIATTPPTGWTEQFDSGGGGARVCFDTKQLQAPQSISTPSRVISSDDWATYTLVLSPEPSRIYVVG